MIDIRDDDGGEKTDAPAKRPVAVALDYDGTGGRAPVVVASGRGVIAEQILGIAFAHGVKVREDADLAEVLAAVDVDSEIPVEAFAAVAEILVYLYKVNRQSPPEAREQGP
ncbi:MAG: EscU/YscU/HrcU family type III secretion system export apparatus switch protein [Magnetospirillum sp. WYHS-4]